jgi:ribosomal protein L9
MALHQPKDIGSGLVLPPASKFYRRTFLFSFFHAIPCKEKGKKEEKERKEEEEEDEEEEEEE